MKPKSLYRHRAPGALNGFCVAVLRFQPIVTTFATSFIFAGLALYVLPEPGGAIPTGLVDFYYTNPLGIPMVLWVVVVLLLLWALLRRRVRIKGSPKLLVAFGKCFPS